ncbi:MAG: urease accessory protein UreE [Polyangiales bacterium]
MLEITARSTDAATPDLTITLVFQDRQRSRLKVALSSGQEALMMMPRGQVLRGGDTVRVSDGRVATITAAPETVSTVRGKDMRQLARAAYHLGNRHMPLEVGDGFLRYLHDHVLDDMVRSLGLFVMIEEAPFEPEGGAYSHSHGDARSIANISLSADDR